MRVAVIGAGMVGVACAWALQRRGLDVQLIDRCEPGTQTSHGNAGIVSPTSLLPINHPGLWAQLPRILSGRHPGVRVRPQEVLARWSAATAFLTHARPSVLPQTTQALHALISFSRPLHQQWLAQAGAEHHWRDAGWLFLYRSAQAWEGAAWTRELYAAHGLTCEGLDAAGLQDLEPDLRQGFGHGLWVRGAGSVDEPGAVVRALAHSLMQRGVRWLQQEVRTLRADGALWRVETASGQCIEVDRVVLALGPWARDFLRTQWGWRLPMLHERGYHMHYAWQGAGLGRPIYDTAAACVLSPMRGGMRLTTGVELDDASAPPRAGMLQQAEAAVRQVLPLGAALDARPWLGSRPTLPDSRPMLDAAPGQAGVWLALGHQHIGFSTGPGSGELLAALMLGEAPPIDPSPFGARRFGSGWFS
jgi:D-amino-acid dehydrogenase